MSFRSITAAFWAVLSLSVYAPDSGAAQWQPANPWRTADYRLTVQERYRPTYWIEGATIGAAVVGTTGAWIAYELGCEFSDIQSHCQPGTVLAGGLVGGLIGGIAGALIGGVFSAPQPRPLRGHPVRATILGASAGAAWSFGLFWQLCLNGCRSEQVVFGLSTTATGALAGLLIGH